MFEFQPKSSMRNETNCTKLFQTYKNFSSKLDSSNFEDLRYNSSQSIKCQDSNSSIDGIKKI